MTLLCDDKVAAQMTSNETLTTQKIAKDITTRTLVGKTRLVDDKTLKLDIDQCLGIFSNYIDNSKTKDSILQLRTGFKNSFTCDMYLSQLDQAVSMKICKNGSFQFTGCITVACAYEAIKYAIFIIKKFIVFETFEILIYEVMSNYRLDLQRKIKQSLLINFFESAAAEYPNYKCFRSTSCSALNCKYVVTPSDILNREVFVYDEQAFKKTVSYGSVSNDIIFHENKDYYITFLVFESGKVIVSGINETIIEKVSAEFIGILNTFFDKYDISLNAVVDMEKKSIKRQAYEKIVLMKIEENELCKQYIVVRGKSTYISSRANKLMIKYNNCKTIYNEPCKNVNVFKQLKSFLKHEQGITFNNVIISVYNNSSEDILLKFLSSSNSSV
jgi:hypothetical protein